MNKDKLKKIATDILREDGFEFDEVTYVSIKSEEIGVPSKHDHRTKYFKGTPYLSVSYKNRKKIQEHNAELVKLNQNPVSRFFNYLDIERKNPLHDDYTFTEKIWGDRLLRYLLERS